VGALRQAPVARNRVALQHTHPFATRLEKCNAILQRDRVSATRFATSQE
jgi:hypothetical protein